LEVTQAVQFRRILHPLDHLEISDEVDVVTPQHFFDEFDQFLFEFFLALEPRRVEVEAERGAVAVQMAVEVVSEKAGELISGLDVRTRVHHVTTGQRLVEGGVVTSVQLVHHYLPDRVATTGAVVCVAVALVGHPEVEGVGPDGHAAQRRGDGGVVDEELVGHHLELLVPADAEVWCADADDGAVGDVGEALDDEPSSGHLGQPVVVRALRPVVGVLLVRQGEDGDLVAAPVQVLHGGVVGVLVRYEEGASDLAAVGVGAGPAEDLLVQVDVVHVDGPVERQRDHLGDVGGLQLPGDAGAVGGAEAVREHALGLVAVGGAIRIGLHSARVFVRFVLAIRFTVAE
jgi:hypothetical protein